MTDRRKRLKKVTDMIVSHDFYEGHAGGKGPEIRWRDPIPLNAEKATW